ncbi:MAG TPA: hypothetical protein VMM38_07660 [Aridibacter sp.]|nr:hypothetical protein [Aridibacter sp.]
MNIKSVIGCFGLVLLLWTSPEAQVATTDLRSQVKDISSGQCSRVPDAESKDKIMLTTLAEVLNETATALHNKRYTRKEVIDIAKVSDDRPVGFFVYDLSEPTNVGLPLGNCVRFVDGHVYHFALLHLPYSFSHIAVFSDDELKIFKAINCRDFGDRIGDVLSYFESKFSNRTDFEAAIERIRRYRECGQYTAFDQTSLMCEDLAQDSRNGAATDS